MKRLTRNTAYCNIFVDVAGNVVANMKSAAHYTMNQIINQTGIFYICLL